MALKTLLLRKKLSEKEAKATEQRGILAQFKTREEELAAAIEEAKTDEEMAAVEEAVAELEKTEEVAKQVLEDVEKEIQDLIGQIEESEKAQEEALDEPAAEDDGEENEDGGDTFRRRGEKRSMNHRMTLRAAEDFKRTGKHTYENIRSLIRAAVVSTSTGVIGPVGVDGINDPVAKPSAMCDLVKLVDATGMAQYKVAAMTADASTAAITEGSAPTESEPTFAAVTFTPSNYGVIGYVSKEIRKQSPLNYEEKVTESSRRALRKRLNALIAAAIPASSLCDTYAITLASTATTGAPAFTADLLSNIILAYGGDEGVDGQACLFLNKKDLKAFAAVRGTNEYLPVYSIQPDPDSPSTGIIKDNNGLSCRYCLSNDVTALCDLAMATTAKKAMFYGNPQNCELPIWGGMDVEVNDGYKFGEGLLTVRGEVTADADVVAQGGFVVVTCKKGS